MLFALCALAVMTLGAVALARSVDSGMLVLGNLGFKKDAVAASSVATEAAISWILSNPGSLDADVPASGYYASARTDVDPTSSSAATNTGNIVLIDWDGNGCKVPGTSGKTIVCLTASGEIAAAGSNKVKYITTRLCTLADAITASNNSCAMQSGAKSSTSSGRGRITTATTIWPSYSVNTTPYRIITRTVGVRGTVAYTETLVHF